MGNVFLRAFRKINTARITKHYSEHPTSTLPKSTHPHSLLLLIATPMEI